MEAVELEDSGEHQQPLDASLASDVIYEDAPVCPCIGTEHQAEIPNLCTEDERHQLMASPLESMLPGFDFLVTVGLAVPIVWGPSEVHKEEGLGLHNSSETEARTSCQDEDGRVTSVCPTSNSISDHDSTFQDPDPVVPVDHIESDANRAQDGNLAPCSTREDLDFANNPMMKQVEVDQFTPLPYSSTSLWSGIEAECFLLGLYIFGKNLSLLSRFVGNKTIGDVLCYYYGKFYKRDAYKRWSDCRKARTRRCILGERIFTSWRQQEIISRLKSVVLKEAHDSLAEIFKSFNDGQTSLEDFVFALKSTVGIEAVVEAVGIGKEKHDLTGFVLDPSKPNQALSGHPDMPTGKDCSSLASEDIIKFLTGDFRRSKTRSNDLFWEAVWPRLLARGWHSEQPKDVSTTKNSLVFLVPGIKRFSRGDLTRGTHYFDSVSDVLKQVAADPVLLDIEVGGMDYGVTAEQNGDATDLNLNQDDPLDGNQELPRYTIIDTTLVQGAEPLRVRELRRLPADAKIRPGTSRHSRNIVNVSSSEEQDVNDRLLVDQEYCGQVAADVNNTEMVWAYNVGKDTENMMAASCSDFPVNGHSSNGSGNKIDLTCLFDPKRKTERRKYLSPVSKRRRLSSCNTDQTSRRSFNFSKGDSSAKEKIKAPSTSSKPTVRDVCGNFRIKTTAGCSTEKPREQIRDASNALTSDRWNEKMKVKNLNEHKKVNVKNLNDKSFECKVDTVPEVYSKITITEAKFGKGAQVSSLAGQVKQEAPLDGKTSARVRAMPSDDHGHMKAEEIPSISNGNQVRDSEVTGGPANPQADLASQADSRRHGTRNRPPTAKALEAVALGFLGGKRKGEPKSPGTGRPPQRPRKPSKDWVYAPTSSDTDNPSMDPDSPM
ncbi:uncharacterized protein LOC124698167 [Lolium rigidum]|uniref:uncharacterized protein LOC124698167 n=1 Tax=Lolium rigidum TaxID=89674 RepID=UPI001F5CB16E|nr:uncharacterized protein LOC124698167 [Lolium rigidum]